MESSVKYIPSRRRPHIRRENPLFVCVRRTAVCSRPARSAVLIVCGSDSSRCGLRPEHLKSEHTSFPTEMILSTQIPPEYLIRPMRPEEYPQLKDFLLDAIFLRPGEATPTTQVAELPALRIYWERFGREASDCALCAERSGETVGAVWLRTIRGYGYAGEGIPELSISVKSPFRNRGIGTALLAAMLAQAKERNIAAVSLSVQRDNPALRLYLRAGFRMLREDGRECVMLFSAEEPD